MLLLCYYGDDMEEYMRLCRWEDNIKMDPHEIPVIVINCIEVIGENLNPY